METTLLTLHAQTSIHAGSGQSDSVIDLPIQREAHTGYPCIFGSSVKGALRSHFENRSDISEDIIGSLFGKEGNNDLGNAGAALISDARLLLLPIRSLTSQYRLVCCPAILNRFKTDAKRFGKDCNFTIPSVKQGEFIGFNQEEENSKVYLEEYAFSRAKDGIDKKLIEILAASISYDNAEDIIKSQLAIISDDDFSYLAQYTMPVNPHIAIDENKVTRNGSLWYEETLPADSVLYVGVAIDEVRKKDGNNADKLVDKFKGVFADLKWLQIGGNETVGMGWCSVKFMGNSHE